jgi:hypothetical protein
MNVQFSFYVFDVLSVREIVSLCLKAIFFVNKC